MGESATSTLEIVMPKLGLTMSEGLIAEWLVRPGDEVRAGQTLFVVETDKVSNEIEAPETGRIVALLVEQGATVDVGTPVATWTVTAPRAGDARRIVSTPYARRLAQQGGVDIALVSGTGARGRVQARDVAAALAQRAPEPAARAVAPRDRRQLIAARVSRSKAEIPHFYLTADVAFDALNKLRWDLNADPAAPRKLGVTAFLGMAVARALMLHPEANVVWRGTHVEQLQEIAIGIAVEAPGGVMAPIVPVTGGIYAFAAAMNSAIDRARGGRLGAGDVGEAAIGISNVGMYRVRSLTPIIDPDQTFMLGAGAPRMTFRPGTNGKPNAMQEVSLVLACDHRAIDGAPAARFLGTIVELLEQPGRLMIEGR
jgi:pyruvate dehydrogenase E2 component (dihydrolipoamide acetyltransferase)